MNSLFHLSFISRWHRSARKLPYTLRPVSQQSPKECSENSANNCLVEHRSFSIFEGRMSAASFLHSSFGRAINTMILWPIRVQKVPRVSEHICPAKLQTSCDICYACLSILTSLKSEEWSLPEGLFVGWLLNVPAIF